MAMSFCVVHSHHGRFFTDQASAELSPHREIEKPKPVPTKEEEEKRILKLWDEAIDIAVEGDDIPSPLARECLDTLKTSIGRNQFSQVRSYCHIYRQSTSSGVAITVYPHQIIAIPIPISTIVPGIDSSACCRSSRQRCRHAFVSPCLSVSRRTDDMFP